MAVAVTTVIDRLTRQAQRHMGKLRERKRRGRGKAAASPASPAAPSRAEGGPRVIRSRGFLVKPMTVDEAVLEVGGSDDGFLVFRDAATERVSVLYRRKDGNLGLIEPEA
jgi:ribosome hibernation promoting factor